jgi:hypothetical protein
MSGQHTPGPWLRPAVQTVRASNGRLIARVDAGGDISGKEVVANASLIAAAPDLLEAAREGRTELMISADNARDAAKTDPRWEGVAEKLMQRVRMMDAAIAKATGAA